MRLEIDRRKTDFLGHFQPEDQALVIEWTFHKLQAWPGMTAPQLAKAIRTHANSYHVKDCFPYLRERLLFIFERKEEVIQNWAQWCIDWSSLTEDEKDKARLRFARSKSLFSAEGRKNG